MASSSSSRNVVKLYILRADDGWKDLGVGSATVSDGAIVVHGEDSSTLLTSEIVVDDVYERQGESIIMWRETGADVDLSLSFQDTAGCVALWAAIEAVQEGILMRTAAAGAIVRNRSSPTCGPGGPRHVLPHMCAANLGEIRDMLWRACGLAAPDVSPTMHYMGHDASYLRQSCIDQARCAFRTPGRALQSAASTLVHPTPPHVHPTPPPR